MAADPLAEFVPPARWDVCAIGVALEQLSDEDREKFELALATPMIQTAMIARRFGARDIRVSETTLRKHRAGECVCER